MFLGGVSLYLVAYSFYNGRFFAGALYFKGEENYDKVETICNQRFGTEEADEGFYSIQWTSQKSFVLLTYDYMEEEGFLTLASTPIGMEKMQADEKKEAEKAEGDW